MVFVAKSVSDGTMVAIKQINLNKQPRKEVILNEIVVMKDSRHQNIVNFVGAYLSHVELWVVMEYMEGGDLTDVIENNESLREDQMAGIMLQVSRKFSPVLVNLFRLILADRLEHFASFLLVAQGTRLPSPEGNHPSR